MNRTWAILPVKSFDRAKSRLASVLTHAQCANLARLMATDVLRALAKTPEIDRVLLLGQGAEQESLAKQFDCVYAGDDPDLDMSANLGRIVQQPDIQSARTVLVVPADLPLLTPHDFAGILQNHKEGVTICRAIRDGGTNAFIASMPQQLVFCFGVDSANLHALAADAAGRKVSMLTVTAFERDIDTADDLQWLSSQDVSSVAVKYLQQVDVAAQLKNPVATVATA